MKSNTHRPHLILSVRGRLLRSVGSHRSAVQKTYFPWQSHPSTKISHTRRTQDAYQTYFLIHNYRPLDSSVHRGMWELYKYRWRRLWGWQFRCEANDCPIECRHDQNGNSHNQGQVADNSYQCRWQNSVLL